MLPTPKTPPASRLSIRAPEKQGRDRPEMSYPAGWSPQHRPEGGLPCRGCRADRHGHERVGRPEATHLDGTHEGQATSVLSASVTPLAEA